MAALDEQQKYLLGRLPNRYDLKEPEELEPAEVKQARKAIEAHTKKVSEKKCARNNAFKKAVEAAREAIYFKKPEDALALVRALEAEFRTKCTC